jgi:nuclear pore complex protein Nup205
MPALQLVSSVLATLGQDHASAGNQALEFLSNHRDTIVILLKHDAEFSALSIVDEVSLLVHLCAEVFPLVPKIDLQTSVSGFGAIHAAALSLAARTLALDAYGIVPQTESETRDSQIRVPGRSSGCSNLMTNLILKM